MGKIISVANPKGGVGKTITSINLAAALAYLNQKVLLIDLDPKADASKGIGIDTSSVEYNVYSIMIQNQNIRKAIMRTRYPNLDVISGSMNMAGFDIESQYINNKQNILKESINEVKDDYDFIIIDCPPSLNMLTINAMTTADSVLVPIQCEYYALEGLSQLIHTINLVKERLNPDLDMEGVVFTMYDSRTNLSMQVVENVKQNLNQRVYNTLIPRNIRLAEAPSYGMPINMYDSKSAGSEAYMSLAEEVISNQ